MIVFCCVQQCLLLILKISWELTLDSDLSRIVQSGSTESNHAFWANQGFHDSGQRVGFELGTSVITSPGDFKNFGPKDVAAFDRFVAGHDHEVTWTDCARGGFVKLVLTAESAKADNIVVENVKTRQYGSYICAV